VQVWWVNLGWGREVEAEEPRVVTVFVKKWVFFYQSHEVTHDVEIIISLTTLLHFSTASSTSSNSRLFIQPTPGDLILALHLHLPPHTNEVQRHRTSLDLQNPSPFVVALEHLQDFIYSFSTGLLDKPILSSGWLELEDSAGYWQWRQWLAEVLGRTA
jgi:hypothetical protein